MNRESVLSFLSSSRFTSVIGSIRPTFQKLPHMPAAVTEILVRIIPWLALVGAILNTLSGLQYSMSAFGIGTSSLGSSNSVYLLLYGVLSLASAYIAFLSFPLLRQRSHLGWVLLFWGVCLSIIITALTLLVTAQVTAWFLVSIALSLYLTFELETFYSSESQVSGDLTKPPVTSKKVSRSK